MKSTDASVSASLTVIRVGGIVGEGLDRLHRGKFQQRDQRRVDPLALDRRNVRAAGQLLASMLVNDVVDIGRIIGYPRVIRDRHVSDQKYRLVVLLLQSQQGAQEIYSVQG
jgi:hypothetical protein